MISSITRQNKQILGFIFFLIIISSMKNFLVRWYTTESTDNAYIEGNISLISSEVPGIIKELSVPENTIVKQKQILIKIEDTDYQAKFAQAEAKVDIAKNTIQITQNEIKAEENNLQKLKNSLDIFKTDIELAKKEYDRNISLSKQNYSSPKVVDNSKLALDKVKNNLSDLNLNITDSENKLLTLNIQLKNNQAELKEAEQNFILAKKALDNTEIRAIDDGTITNISAKAGNYATPGVPILSFVRSRSLDIKANFKETQIGKMKTGSAVEIFVDAIPGHIFKGKVKSFYPATGSQFSLLPVDNSTGNFTKVVQRIPVIINFDIPEQFEQSILPGMSVVVYVKVK